MSLFPLHEKTSVTDAAFCCQVPVISNDRFIPQLLRQLTAVNLFPELPPLKEFPHLRSWNFKGSMQPITAQSYGGPGPRPN